MKKILLFGFMLTLCFGAPSALGTSGLINMPTALATAYKEYDMGANWKIIQNASNSDRFQINYFANMGVFDNCEFGFIGNNLQEGVFLNFKYFAMTDKSAYPLSLAAGLTNLSSKTRSDLYMVLSKKFPNSLTGHFGFASNILASNIRANIMFGLEFPMSKNVIILGDLIGSDNSWNLSSGLRIKMSEDMLLNAYLEDIGSSTVDKATFTIGFTMHGLFQ